MTKATESKYFCLHVLLISGRRIDGMNTLYYCEVTPIHQTVRRGKEGKNLQAFAKGVKRGKTNSSNISI